MGKPETFSTDELLQRGSIQDADVVKLRRIYYDDGVIGPVEAETLFKIHSGCRVQDPSWQPFFVEVLSDYIVRQAQPEGYVTSENASWLIDQVSVDGHVRSKVELELLVTVLDIARWSPPSLITFCIDQVRNAVTAHESPLRDGANDDRGKIHEGEVELIRRMIYGFGGDGCISVTRPEAEVLFDINDAVADDGVNAAWTEFFVKAVANVVMASSGYKVPTREEALRAEAWLDERGDLSPANMISAIVNAGLNGVIAAYSEQSPEERALARLERQRLEIVTNEEVTADEAEWLAERLTRDGRLTETEDALVDYLSKHASKLHPILQNAVSSIHAAA